MINIVLATDDNFVQHCSVVIASVLKNNKDVSIFIFTEGLKPENERILKDVTETLGGHLTICLMEGDVVSQFPMPSFMSSHISIATYYRLFVEKALPDDIDKVLYLDCDIVVRGSLEPLWEMNLSDKALGAVYQFNEWAFETNAFERLGYKKECGYFNAGVLLINLKYWREHDVTNQLMSFIKDHYSQIHSHDQDVLNAVLNRYVLPLSYTWNCLPCFLEKEKFTFPDFVDYSSIIKDPVIVHYVNKPKPWQFVCSHPYRDDYYEYLDITPFSGWRPKFAWKEYKEFILIPRLSYILVKLDVLNLRKVLKRN